jgi:hypothetical protein
MRRSILFVALITLFVASDSLGDTVRGKVVHPDGVTAHVNAAVTLESPAIGRSGTAYTGNDGMFQLEKVPAGEYTMEIKTARETKRLRVVVEPKAYTDIAPVSIR